MVTRELQNFNAKIGTSCLTFSLIDLLSRILKILLNSKRTAVGQNADLEGWVYIGHFLASKNGWDYVDASRLQGGDPTLSDLQSGQQLRTTDQLYVRASAPPGAHSTGAVLDLIPQGQIMNIEEVERTGGERVFAKVSKTGS